MNEPDLQLGEDIRSFLDLDHRGDISLPRSRASHLASWLPTSSFFEGFCSQVDSQISSLNVLAWRVYSKIDVETRNKLKLVASVTVGNGVFQYNTNIVRNTLEGLQKESLVDSYISIRSVPEVSALTDQIYKHVRHSPLYAMQQTNVVKNAIVWAYKARSKSVLESNNRRLRALAYVTTCSSDFKSQVDRLQKDLIRPRVTKLLDQLYSIATTDDIKFFMAERDMLSIMES